MRRLLVALSVGLMALNATAPVRAQAPAAGPWATPSDAQIKAMLAQRIDAEHSGVGIVVGVIDARGRRIVSYGVRDQADPRPVDGKTIFEIGSMTKVFTSLILMDMVQKHEVSLDDPVSKFLPASVNVPERAGRNVS